MTEENKERILNERELIAFMIKHGAIPLAKIGGIGGFHHTASLYRYIGGLEHLSVEETERLDLLGSANGTTVEECKNNFIGHYEGNYNKDVKGYRVSTDSDEYYLKEGHIRVNFYGKKK